MASQNASARAAARDQLRGQLSRHYRLEQYDLFFAPSLHIARVLLSQLFLRQEQARNQTRYASHYPVSELSILAAVPVMAGNIALVEHIDLFQGRVRALAECQSQGVTDASESFATLLHRRLISEARLFVTRLDRHAALGTDLVLIALRTHDFSTLVRSELRLFEQGLALGDAPEQALAQMAAAQWRPYNIASVDTITLEAPFSLQSLQQPGLSFAVLPIMPGKLPNSPQPDLHQWPERGRVLLRANVRGSANKSQNMTMKLTKRLRELLNSGRNSENAEKSRVGLVSVAKGSKVGH
ncbi:hypothetical protein L579_1486 [Pantoea sp. AS-PWVM4]|uniref:DUF6024 family protein n=1 Tax=Pantoea phytobeneficialis TaxID=2052056 RepID=A0AAP9H3R9_9GAMM|nr:MULTISPECIES: DUF6024 family protein [Pantoea]ERK18166.1 hypothetical protein L579_1486 [Pantoea sp. AS-PWVM4]MDO6407257.1 DUF6024 family protein [Pantoea phytobeneficialis]QGR05821.1 hypothetical protein CTZ24_05090 [Pantoea phytobeneficialis]